MTYRLHCFCQSGNAFKVATMLNLLGEPWEAVFVDFFNGETRRPDWREAEGRPDTEEGPGPAPGPHAADGERDDTRASRQSV